MSELEMMCNEYRDNKRLIEELTAMNEEIKNKLVNAMNGESKVVFGAAKVSNILVNTTKLDSKAVKEAFPEAFESCSKASSYYRFTIA